jgi:peptidoglycan hydrolase-like protein with peptidoglycan-binding domain
MVAIVTRAQWRAPTPIPGGRNVPLSSRRWFVVHWPGSAVGGDAAQAVRNIDHFHRTGNRWAVIGYNFLVARDGTIFEGAGLNTRGIHEPSRNTDGFGVCCLISVGESPPQAMLNATRALHAWLSGRAGRTLSMGFHGQFSATAFAGPALNQWVRNGMPATGGAPAPPPPVPGPPGSPPWPGRILRQPPIMRGEDVRTWQARVRARGWSNVVVDGAYGPISEGACRQVQQIARLSVDGRVGPNTWPATWRDSQGPPGGAAPAPGGVPPWPGRILRQPPHMQGEDVRAWQARVRARADLPDIAVDGWYGPISEGAARQVQQIARLSVDGRVGPNTWPAPWTTGAGAVR